MSDRNISRKYSNRMFWAACTCKASGGFCKQILWQPPISRSGMSSCCCTITEACYCLLVELVLLVSGYNHHLLLKTLGASVCCTRCGEGLHLGLVSVSVAVERGLGGHDAQLGIYASMLTQ